MKKTHFISIVAILAAFCAVSCNKNHSGSDSLPEQQEASYGNVRISLNTSGDQATKVLSASAAETRINSVQVFIFNKASGKRETDRFENISGTVSDSYSMTLTSLTGEKVVWAVVNSPRITNVATLDALKQKVSDLGENSATNLLMSGFNENVLVRETNANVSSQQDVVTDASINVFRLGARISLNAVTVDFSNTDLENASFTVTGLYLKNVVGKTRIDGSGIDLTQAANWYNMSNQAAVTSAPAVIQAITKDMPLTVNCNSSGSATAIGYSWYVYPNTTTSAQDTNAAGASVPRSTRLVIKAHLGGASVGGTLNEDTYYVFTIPEIKRNNAYNITSLKITMRGKPDDNSDEPTNSGQVRATITVQDWDSNETLTYEF